MGANVIGVFGRKHGGLEQLLKLLWQLRGRGEGGELPLVAVEHLPGGEAFEELEAVEFDWEHLHCVSIFLEHGGHHCLVLDGAERTRGVGDLATYLQQLKPSLQNRDLQWM